MGSKFCNLNIYCTTPIEITHEIPQGHIYQCAAKWLTMTSPVFEWGNTQKYAKDLSKTSSCPVLSTEYFDDDFVEFALYHYGKLVTKHIPVSYEDFKKKKGNAAKIIDCLSLNILEESALKRMLSVTDCEESVYLLESYLGCPIFGIKDECPPTEAPDRTLFNSFVGGKSDVVVEFQKNHARVGEPPYAMDPDAAFIPSTILNDTIICFTDKPEHIIRKIELWFQRMDRDRNYERYFGDAEPTDAVQIVLGNNRVTIQGMGACCIDDYLSREFKCLVFVLNTGANAFERILDCSMAYGGKRLFRASRGTEGTLEPLVIPNVLLESPFLTLLDGELVSSFETANIEDVIFSFEKLFDAPIHPINPEEYQLIKSGDRLRVFKQDK